MFKYRLLGFLLLASPIAGTAIDFTWLPLTSIKQNQCDINHRCQVRNKLVFDVHMTPEETNRGFALREVQIGRLGEKHAATYKYDPPITNASNEPYELYRLRIRPEGFEDLALRTYSSAGEGAMYYYFFYDEKSRSFIQTKETYPKLTYDRATGDYVSDLQKNHYRLNSAYEFEPVEVAGNGASTGERTPKSVSKK